MKGRPIFESAGHWLASYALRGWPILSSTSTITAVTGPLLTQKDHHMTEAWFLSRDTKSAMSCTWLPV